MCEKKTKKRVDCVYRNIVALHWTVALLVRKRVLKFGVVSLCLYYYCCCCCLRTAASFLHVFVQQCYLLWMTAVLPRHSYYHFAIESVEPFLSIVLALVPEHYLPESDSSADAFDELLHPPP